MGQFAPTDEQTAIVDAASTGKPLVIEAGAGTGKTSTLIQIAEANPDKTFMYLAFNRSIKDEAEGKFPSNVRCYTTHGLASRSNPEFRRKLEATKGRQTTRQLMELLNIRSGYRSKRADLDLWNIAAYARDMVSRFARSSDDQLQWWHLAKDHVPMCDVEERKQIASVIMPYAQAMWNDLQTPYPRYKFEHDHYRKIWALSKPNLGVDAVLFDEAQDAQRVVMGVVKQQTNSQTIVVGDSAQEIYTFTGAVNSMGSFDGDHLYLTKSFRFGPAVAEVANLFLEDIGSPMRLTGFDKIESTVGDRIADPDAILCRTNGEAISQVLNNMNRRVALAGGGRELIALTEAAAQLLAGRKPYNPELAAFPSWGAVQDYVERDPSGRDLKTFVSLVETHGTEKIIRTLKRLVTPGRGVDLTVSTAHKAKGLEWKGVQIGNDFASPFDKDKDGNVKEVTDGEKRLAYVAVTRAEQRLGVGSLKWIFESEEERDNPE